MNSSITFHGKLIGGSEFMPFFELHAEIMRLEVATARCSDEIGHLDDSIYVGDMQF